MNLPVRAIETTGVIDEKRQLRLDTPLPENIYTLADRRPFADQG